ncbi:MAG: leucyl aminopeptidase family protein [Gammaproteobacteria bacterium]|nr:leucyl aminopeptidase family protein [Gammaproteobacteria bacterium]
MLNCFYSEPHQEAISVAIVSTNHFPTWLISQNELTKTWLSTTQFRAENTNTELVPNEKGMLSQVITCTSDEENLWSVGHLPYSLPEGHYQLDNEHPQFFSYAIAWGLGAYQFARYKKPLRQAAKLYLPPEQAEAILNIVSSIHLVRDCINTPTDDMGPTEFAAVTEDLAKQYGATFTQLIGEELLQQNYATIHTVGRASDDAPRLLDLRWGNITHPKITLVGKGVCFDSGGLDLKSSQHMLLMKKDMGGGAHVLGLARMIMQAKLPVCLRVLIPVVENVISGNAFRPGDIIKSRQGLTIEIGNTDAEGRLVLADALAEAVTEKPDLLIDISTLTGAARVALGTDLPALFCNQDKLAEAVIKQGEKINDPMWRLPLFSFYREYLNSPIADINNNSSEPYAGAITAALFLKEFVPDDIPWLHFDIMAWNLRSRPGRPQGGEAMTLRALFAYLQERFG